MSRKDSGGGASLVVTPDGRYFVVRGRLWRMSDPALPEAEREAHVQALIRDRGHGARIVDEASAIRLALPVTILTLLLGAALWPFYPGATANRLLCLTIQGLAALTLPHLLFEVWLSRRASPR